MYRCYVGLGSNLEGPRQQVVQAISELASLSACQPGPVSSLYRSRPLGPQDQPHYINAVAALDTSLPALQLLDQLQVIEAQHGRVREQHWGPRTLDLDLLLYGDEQINEARLKVPHPEMFKRNFVVIPLLEIANGLMIPGVGSLREQAAGLDRTGLEKLDPHA